MPGWIRDESGVKVPLGASGTLIGRDATCNVVIEDPEVSRRHALILSAEGRTQIVPLGRRPAMLAGAPVEVARWVEDGDELVVGKARFFFELKHQDAPLEAWALEVNGRVYPVHRSPFTAGGGASDDLQIEGWPEGAVKLFRVEGRLLAETEAPIEIDGAARDEELYPLELGARIRREGQEIRLVKAQPASATIDDDVIPKAVALEFVPNGAVLRLMLPTERVAFLPNKRADLVAALLSPTHGQKAGDWIPDEVLNERIWGSQGGSRAQLNTLIHRTRVSLSEAGVDGPSLIQRAPGGGATRLLVTRATTVTIT